METSNLNVHPKVAAYMIDMQMEHDLPIELQWKKKAEDGTVDMVLKYQLEDYGAFSWLVNKSVNQACAEITRESKKYD